jgi:hypothetical protein
MTESVKLPPDLKRELIMCEGCDHLTEKLKQYERLRLGGLDKLTMDRIEVRMVEIRAERAALHSQETERL